MWTTDAPLTPEQMAEDRPILKQVSTPPGTVLESLEIYVNGRLWYWQKPPEVYGDLGTTWVFPKFAESANGATDQ